MPGARCFLSPVLSNCVVLQGMVSRRALPLHAIAESTAGAQAGEGERRQIILPSYMHGCTPEVHERVDHDAICPLTPRERLFVVLRPLGLWSIC